MKRNRRKEYYVTEPICYSSKDKTLLLTFETGDIITVDSLTSADSEISKYRWIYDQLDKDHLTCINSV